MIYDKIKAYGFQALSLVLLVLLASQTWRLHLSQLREAKAITTLAQEQAVAAAVLASSQGTIRNIENALSIASSDNRKVTNEKVITLNTQRDVLLKRVRSAESKASADLGLSKATTASCDGTGLKRPVGTELLATLGEEDVEEAHRGDVLRSHLASCYKQYDAAREALSK